MPKSKRIRRRMRRRAKKPVKRAAPKEVKKGRRVYHRFKIQERVDVMARDQSNKPFLFTRQWRTVAEADHQPTAEIILQGVKHDQPGHTFRIAEVWPEDAMPRVIVGPR